MFLFRNYFAYFLEDAYNTEAAAEEILMESVTGVGFRCVMMVIIIILAVLVRRPEGKDADYSKVLNIMVLAASIQMLSVFDNVYSRLADYFYQFVVLFVPMFMVPAKTQEELETRNDSLISGSSIAYVSLSLGVTAFSIWFYSTQIQNIDMYGKICFFWELNGHQLYGR